MNSKKLLTLGFSLALPFAAVFAGGCVDLNSANRPYDSGYGNYGGYGDPYYGRDRHHDWDRERRDREKWERRNDRWEQERRRHDEDRKHDDHHRAPPPPPPPMPTRVPELRCPPGTHPSTHRCTKEERKRGCKDYGAGDGRGCSNF